MPIAHSQIFGVQLRNIFRLHALRGNLGKKLDQERILITNPGNRNKIPARMTQSVKYRRLYNYADKIYVNSQGKIGQMVLIQNYLQYYITANVEPRKVHYSIVYALKY